MKYKGVFESFTYAHRGLKLKKKSRFLETRERCIGSNVCQCSKDKLRYTIKLKYTIEKTKPQIRLSEHVRVYTFVCTCMCKGQRLRSGVFLDALHFVF